jgi:hypothetical protein
MQQIYLLILPCTTLLEMFKPYGTGVFAFLKKKKAHEMNSVNIPVGTLSLTCDCILSLTTDKGIVASKNEVSPLKFTL